MMETIIQRLNKQAINDDYLYELLKKIQFNFGKKIFGENVDSLNKQELIDILRFSDILSRSSDSFNRNISLKIVSTLFDEYKDNRIYQLFAQNVMVKLGNFPSLEILEHYGGTINNDEIEIDKLIKQVFQGTSIKNRYFTDSQYEVIQSIKNSNHYSFSAGTSFGKSFLFAEYINWLIEEKNSSENIAFLVPTRALITQVVRDLTNFLSNEKYRIVDNPEIPALYRNKKFIFVFTPERLISYFSNKKNPNISTMIIDEAQNIIAEDERSPMFYHAITLAQQKSVNLYFASPNIPNPSIFLELVGSSTEESQRITDVNVIQNKFFVDFIEHKATIYYDYLKNDKSYELPFNRYSFEEFILLTTKGNQSIIYCNTVNDTVREAQKLISQLKQVNDTDLIELSKFIQDTIHEDYFLAELVKYQIGFHFGALPQVVRERIESEFKQGHLKYLFTTSTLLQGVNLPAKNLFILSEKLGQSKLTSLDFKNLAGRAGRLSEELYGNIFIVRLEEKRWSGRAIDLIGDSDLPKVESMLLTGKNNFYKNIGNTLIERPLTNKNMLRKNKRIISDYASILAFQHKKGVTSQLSEKFSQKNSERQKIYKLITDFTVPEDILMMSTTIKPKYQEMIYKDDNPYIFNDGYDYDDCLKILSILTLKYDWKNEEDKRQLGNANKIAYYALLMSDWIKSRPLNVMIVRTIDFLDKNRYEIEINHNPNKRVTFSKQNIHHVNQIINELLRDIENVIRFKIKNYVTNYLMLTNQDDGEWHNYLEYGTNDKITIELQKIGFERQVSIELKKYTDCFELNSNEEIIAIDKSKLLKKEINKVTRAQIEILL